MNWTVILHINHWHRELWWWIELSFYTSITVIENFDDELNCYSTHQSLSSRTLVMNWTVILHINHWHRELWWWIELSFYTSITVIENFDDELNCYSTHQSLSSRTLVMNWTVILHINHCHRELWWWIELLFYTSITVIENFDDELNCYSTHQSLSSRTLVMNWTVILHINHCHRELWWWIELLFYTSITDIENFDDELNCYSTHQSLS